MRGQGRGSDDVSRIRVALGPEHAGLEALEQGTTAIVDHHESPNAIEGSLETIAAELGETAVGSDHYGALFTIGIFLFIITFIINLTADLVVRGIKKK